MMLIPDVVNGAFELLGGAFVSLNCRALWRDRQIRGISIIAMTFFTAWGYWNLFYYPYLGQIASFCGGLAVTAANSTYMGMFVYILLTTPNSDVVKSL